MIHPLRGLVTILAYQQLDNNSYFGCINKKFGPLSKGEGEDPIEETDNEWLTKKTKLDHNAGILSKEPNYSRDEIFSQPKTTKKKGVCLEDKKMA